MNIKINLLIYSIITGMLLLTSNLTGFAENNKNKIAENADLILYYEQDTGRIGLQEKASGYLWWSSPEESDFDLSDFARSELYSSHVLSYGNQTSQAVATLRSQNAAEITFQKIPDGFIISYYYEKCGITVPVKYVLEDAYLSVSVLCSEIREEKRQKNILATELALMPAFGAGTNTENGCFVIPDGCGALIRFENVKKDAKAYQQKVYGRDLTNLSSTKPDEIQQIQMPVYGIVKENHAMTVIIEKGAGNAVLNASTSAQNTHAYHTCYFSFQLRGSDQYQLAGDSRNLTVFESGVIKTEEIKLRYYPVSGEKTGYVQVAETYRNYLLQDEQVTKKTLHATELYLHTYGGTMQTHSILGIPVTTKTSVTNYAQTQEILQNFMKFPEDQKHPVLIYHNWTDAGISGKVDRKAKPSDTLGGEEDFRNLLDYLKENQILCYPAVNNKTFHSGNGYQEFLHTAIRISGSYSRQPEYDLAYGIQDTSVKAKSLLSPCVFRKLYAELAESYSQYGLHGCCLGEMTSALWGDYGKKSVSRDQAIIELQASYEKIQASGLSLLADSCCAYALPYVDKITDMPLESSHFDIFDEDVPFCQIVLHGIIPYASTAINQYPDCTQAFLKAIAFGCQPAYDLIYAQASDLKDTDLEQYYYANYASWLDTIREQYRIASEILSDVSNQIILDYDYDNQKQQSVTIFEDGTEIKIDYAGNRIFRNHQLCYQLKDRE